MKRMFLICALALLLVPCLAQADVSPWMSYQGVLRDGSGNAVPNGSYDVTFRIYDVETGGTALWTENQTLTATGGIINAYLGSVVMLTTLAFDVPYWLGISVETEDELVPRTPSPTVPYAGHAGFACPASAEARSRVAPRSFSESPSARGTGRGTRASRLRRR